MSICPNRGLKLLLTLFGNILSFETSSLANPVVISADCNLLATLSLQFNIWRNMGVVGEKTLNSTLTIECSALILPKFAPIPLRNRSLYKSAPLGLLRRNHNGIAPLTIIELRRGKIYSLTCIVTHICTCKTILLLTLWILILWRPISVISHSFPTAITDNITKKCV